MLDRRHAARQHLLEQQRQKKEQDDKEKKAQEAARTKARHRQEQARKEYREHQKAAAEAKRAKVKTEEHKKQLQQLERALHCLEAEDAELHHATFVSFVAADHEVKNAHRTIVHIKSLINRAEAERADWLQKLQRADPADQERRDFLQGEVFDVSLMLMRLQNPHPHELPFKIDKHTPGWVCLRLKDVQSHSTSSLEEAQGVLRKAEEELNLVREEHSALSRRVSHEQRLRVAHLPVAAAQNLVKMKKAERENVEKALKTCDPSEKSDWTHHFYNIESDLKVAERDLQDAETAEEAHHQRLKQQPPAVSRREAKERRRKEHEFNRSTQDKANKKARKKAKNEIRWRNKYGTAPLPQHPQVFTHGGVPRRNSQSHRGALSAVHGRFGQPMPVHPPSNSTIDA
ncbi:hypothetical protein T439DRAFT_383307 [Meredithblackwellia eburnea MCA 4105]